jgi:hypothetical protein
MTARELYESLTSYRSAALQTARDAAKLTIPSLIPPEGTSSNTTLPSPYQSLGAYGVNNLSAKLLLALYPPGTACFRYVLPEDIAQEASAIPQDTRQEIEKRLASIENRALQRFETSVIRPLKAETLTHLIVAGNVLTCFKSLTDFRVFRLDQYVCRRDPSGKPLDVVVHEKVNPRSLPDDVKEACEIKADQKEDVSVYTHVAWNDGKCAWYQEINGKKVPGSDGDSPADISPWNPLRWRVVPGSDYGRGHCEEYLGALTSLEGLSQSIVEFAAVAAKVVFVVKPGAATDPSDLNRAAAGEYVTGEKDDIASVGLERYADFQVVERVRAGLEEMLSRAFLLRTGLVRDAERVTAEEIRGTAQELEDTLGGVYTVLAQEDQLPFIRRLLHVLTVSRDIPRLPPGSVTPVIVTGFQALGRNHALNKLRGFLSDLSNMLGPENVGRVLNTDDIAARLALGWGIESAGDLIKSKAQLAQEAAQAQQSAVAQTVLEKGVGPAASALMSEPK